MRLDVEALVRAVWEEACLPRFRWWGLGIFAPLVRDASCWSSEGMSGLGDVVRGEKWGRVLERLVGAGVYFQLVAGENKAAAAVTLRIPGSSPIEFAEGGGFLRAAVAGAFAEFEGSRSGARGRGPGSLRWAMPQKWRPSAFPRRTGSWGVQGGRRYGRSGGAHAAKAGFGEGEAEVDGELATASSARRYQFGFGDGLGVVAEMTVEFSGGVETAGWRSATTEQVAGKAQAQLRGIEQLTSPGGRVGRGQGVAATGTGAPLIGAGLLVREWFVHARRKGRPAAPWIRLQRCLRRCRELHRFDFGGARHPVLAA